MTLEKILGTNYKWWYFIKYVFKINLTYIWNEVLASLNRVVALLASLIIFTYLQKESQEFVTYLIIGNIFFATTDANISWFLGNSIKDGKISRYLILPQNFNTFIAYNGLSNTIYMLITYMISLIPIALFFYSSLVFSWNVLILLLFWPIAVGVRLFLEFMAGLSAFWTTEFYGAAFLNITLISFLSGSIFPLNFISEKLPLLDYTPFAVLFYHPMQIYLGKYDLNQIISVFVGGFIWVMVLFLLSQIMFKNGLKRNESVGL
jgi:ABC-2 type transport system permease protein